MTAEIHIPIPSPERRGRLTKACVMAESAPAAMPALVARADPIHSRGHCFAALRQLEKPRLERNLGDIRP
jgi:hypothetical protein